MNKRVFQENITHKELVELGRGWLIKPYAAMADYGHSGCGIVITEISTAIAEQPDVIGFSGKTSILIECKASRADFNADKDKPFRMVPETGIGSQRWYMAPQGVISVENVPPRWGLLEVTPERKIRTTKKAEPQEHNQGNEILVLISLLRRLNIQPYGNVAIKKYVIESGKNRATFFINMEEPK